MSDNIKQEATFETLREREKQIELDERAAQVELRKLEIARLTREKAALELAEQDRAENSRRKGAALRDQLPCNRFKNIRKSCNHRMGSTTRQPLNDLRSGLGGGEQYCVTKTKLPTGDIIVRCQRCRTVWVPAWQALYWKSKQTQKYLPSSQTANMTSKELQQIATFDHYCPVEGFGTPRNS
jgi:predicted Zn finger-like uncharacterized protein